MLACARWHVCVCVCVSSQMSNCSPSYRVITQATLPLAFSAPRQCTPPPAYGRRTLEA